MSRGETRGEPLVVVSPHPDDAAYSVGGLLSKGAFGGPIFGVTVFTRSHSMTYGEPPVSTAIGEPLSVFSSQPRINRIEQRLTNLEVTKVRKKEDEKYFRAIGVPRIDLDLLDAPLRGHGWSPWVSDMAVVRKDPILGEVTHQFGNLSAGTAATSSSEPASESGRCVMLLPLGLGGHVDHLVVREACSGLGGNHVRLYYEDLPYAARLAEEEIERVVRDFDSDLKPHLFSIRDSLVEKIENLKLYKSQVGDKEVECVQRHANRLGRNREPCERLWYRTLPNDCRVRESLARAEYLPS